MPGETPIYRGISQLNLIPDENMCILAGNISDLTGSTDASSDKYIKRANLAQLLENIKGYPSSERCFNEMFQETSDFLAEYGAKKDVLFSQRIVYISKFPPESGYWQIYYQKRSLPILGSRDGLVVSHWSGRSTISAVLTRVDGSRAGLIIRESGRDPVNMSFQ